LIARLDVEEAVGDETCYVVDGDGVVLGCVAGEDGDGGAIGGGSESAEEGGEEGEGILHVGWWMGIGFDSDSNAGRKCLLMRIMERTSRRGDRVFL
jgi:hypothetical protein